ncbi:MAG: cell surface protein SprA, partial [Hymenobacter sp.]|nr:cell surface protein SprA [Hymenobacter sp.]
AVAATVRGTADEVRIQNGAQSRQYEIKASQYEKDRHFFLSHFFRERYDQALRNLPTIQSGVSITRLEVYVTNDNRTTENLRNVVTLMDLAEPFRLYQAQKYRIGNPSIQAPANNAANSQFGALTGPGATRDNILVDDFLQSAAGQGLTKNVDFERVRARKLDTREYTFNAQLGYLSLNTALLPDQVLGVSFEYIYNGKTYKVGELSGDYNNVTPDQVIFLKMLKASNPGVGIANPALNPQNTNLLTLNTPTWDLMMKNIYPLNASQLQRDNFQLQIIYKDDATGVDLISLKEGAQVTNRPLVEVLNLDHVNSNNDKIPDGNFDYFPGITIDPELGKIIFPNVQPFGSFLQSKFTGEQPLIDKYVYNELYNQTQSDAQQRQEKDKFFLRGRFQGGAASDEINLPGIGIAQGSVRVRSGSTLLTEGTDYQVFYDQAKVKILNPAYLNSANELRVEFEKNALVQVQPRKLLGVRLDYRLNKDVIIGGTALHLLENQAPGINRVNIGDEPGNNTIIGLDGSIRKDSRVLTKYLDMLPFVSTKEISTIAFSGEFAKLLPGRSQLGNGENGVSYIDDFENARTPYTLGGLASIPAWRLASTPLPIKNSAVGGLPYNYQRAKLAWYTVDQSYYTGGASVPGNIGAGDLLNHYTRGIKRDEVFPNKDLGSTGNGFEYSFDLAYFPEERGPYNYNPSVSSDGKLLNPGPNSKTVNQGNFAGISRAITFDTDFDNANIEYLEFWMMDPFLKATNPNADAKRVNITDQDGNDNANLTGGDFVINLGNVSEDVLKDGNQHEFENGLPVTNDPQDVKDNTNSTVWGRVTRQQFLTDAFNAAPGARTAQDVGLDGLSNDNEKNYFSNYPPALGTVAPVYGALPDPSGDDFRHHLDPSYDQNNTKILGRYKNYDGYDGNSPENSQLSSTAFPDKEDLNRDNVVQDVERYYEYKMSLKPGNLNVGSNYIIDNVKNNVNGEDVNWYLFRIPIREGYKVQGNGGKDFGFKSIRFLRMYMTNWQDPVVLRLVQPQFVANQWRRFLYPIVDVSQGSIPPQGTLTDADAFNISTVSVEENGIAVGNGIPYVSPPGILRDKEYGSSSTSRLQNEQSLRLAVVNLRDGFAKAAYKNITINMLRYKRLRMFLHGDSDDPTTLSGDVRAFLRIGTDYSQNYYQYSLPLKLTAAGDQTPDGVWPTENRIDVSFQDFIDAKAKRNQQANPNLLIPFTVTLDNGATITVVGNPDFSAVQGVMLGILNPTDPSTAEKTVNLWADEFRVFDFEQQAGYAATARLNVKLADVANVTATGSFTSVGFGGLQDKVQQRSVDDVFRGDLNTTVAVEKFLPPQLNLRLPVLLQIGRESRSPLYDPLDPDTKLEQSLLKFKDPVSGDVNTSAQAEYRKKVIDQTTSRSISVLNVRKERALPKPGALPAKPKPWDIENVALSYSITDRLHSDIRTDRDYTKAYTAAVAYVYQTTPKNYTPLANFKALDNPYLKIFQQINFTPLPSRFSFRTDLDRRYNERFLQRVLNPGEVPTTDGIAPVIQKSFFISRIYDLKWDLTKSLIFDYTATNRGVIDEGTGRTIGVSDEAIRNRSQLQQNLLRGGRTVNFNQTAALTYRLPLDKFPLTDWLSADTRYAATYSWQAAAQGQRALNNPTSETDTTTYQINVGNTIQNNAEISANGKIDLVKLYNKVKFLNIINNAPPPQARPGAMRPNLGDANAAAKPAPAADTTREKLRFVKAVLRSLMTARSINFTFSRSNGTLLPGYLPKTKAFGLDETFTAPGVPFILGQQYSLQSLYDRANGNGWYTDRSEFLNTPLSSLLTQTITLRTALEPFRDFNIQVDARQQKVQNLDAYYRHTVDEQTLIPLRDANNNYLPIVPQTLGSGSFQTSTITINTLFGDLSANGETSKAFQRFVDNRLTVRNKLAVANQSPNGTYGYNSQDVLVQSFIDAYHGRSSDGYQAKEFNPFAMIPLPNWRVDYNGFAQLPLIKQYFSSFTLNHAYSSIYSIGSYTTTNTYSAEPSFGSPGSAPINPFQVNASNQYLPYYVVGQVSIVETLAPLIGVNFQTVNKVTGRIEYRTNRTVALNITNAQVTELSTKEFVIGFGYATNSLKLPFKVGGEQRVLKNNLTARLDLSIRDNITIQRSIIDSADPDPSSPTLPDGFVGRAQGQITNGSKTFQLRPTIDYLLNTRLNLQFYYSQTITTPRISNAFRNSNTEGGIQLRYSLTQ